MSDNDSSTHFTRIKTGSFERRLSLTRAGLVAGTRFAGDLAASVFTSKGKRAERRKDALSKQAQYLVDELSKLKGSVVKIGQVMALYGEHFLPVEVTQALHTLEDRTTALSWPVIERVLKRELGTARLAELDIEPIPIGAASLGQVHRARRRADGAELCIKVQYPGVAESIDSDIDAVAMVLKMARLVSLNQEFREWLDEVRVMMHREVDYHLELDTTRRFGLMLADDPRFVVPQVYPEYSSGHTMTTSYESGFSVTDAEVADLSQARRNNLAKAALELFLREIFCWGELQTDPNFGNYRIKIDSSGQSDSVASEPESDQLVLLDFGAVQKYPDHFIQPLCRMIRAAYEVDLQNVIAGGMALKFMRKEWPAPILEDFGRVCIDMLEPLAQSREDVPDFALNAAGEYRWNGSDLPNRVAKRATRSAFNRYFRIPPKEFVFINRKLVGVYTFISVLNAEFEGQDILTRYLYPSSNSILQS